MATSRVAPLLDGVQLGRARQVVQAVRRYPGVGDSDHKARACDIALAVCLAESSLRVLYNPNVQGSFAYAHDGVGHDHLSVGLYQQQVPMWGTAAQCMSVSRSTGLFLRELLKFDWTSLSNWSAAQRVQRSSFSDGSNYRRQDALAIITRKFVW